MPFRTTLMRSGLPTLTAVLLTSSVATAQLFDVTDLGATGRSNVAWSLNQIGDVAGWSRFDEGPSEGFVYAQGSLAYVGFIGGTSSSNVAAVNNLGHGIGTSGTTHENQRAFIWDGHRVNLGTLGGNRSNGSSINDLGQAVGWSRLADNFSTRAFLWEDGEMIALPTLGGEHAGANWINNNGQIVGRSSEVPENYADQYAVLWEDGAIYRLPPNNARIHGAWYIHDNGDIAGVVRLLRDGRTISRAAIWRDRELFLELGTLADGTPFEDISSSVAYGINADGVIVGMSGNATGDGYVPFIYRNGVMIQLDHLMPAPWVAINVGPGAINDAGQIAVEAVNGDGTSHALLLTPRWNPAGIRLRK